MKKATVYAVVWTKKGAEGCEDTNEGDIVCEEGHNLKNEWFTIDYPFFEDKKDAIKSRNKVSGFKVVKMEITYKEI